jgi:hypothetical protein
MSELQPGPSGSRRFMAFVAFVVGPVLLLPGLCSLFFTPTAFDALKAGDIGSYVLVLWITGLLIGGLGVALIARAVWRAVRS